MNIVTKLSRYLGCLIALLGLVGAVDCRAQNVWTKVAGPTSGRNWSTSEYQFVNDSVLYAFEMDYVYESDMYGQYIAGAFVRIHKSVNAGSSWKLVDSILIYPANHLKKFSSILVLNDSTFRCYGSQVTSEGGSNWSPLWGEVIGKREKWESMSIFNNRGDFILEDHSRDGYDFVWNSSGFNDTAASAPKFFRVNSAGNWDTLIRSKDPILKTADFFSATFRDSAHGVLCVTDTANSRIALRTSDRGISWTKCQFEGQTTYNRLVDIHVVSGKDRNWASLCVYRVDSANSYNYSIERSSDDGAHWSTDHGAPPNVRGLIGSNDSQVYCVVQGSATLYREEALGSPWSQVLFNLPGSSGFSGAMPDFVGDSLIYENGFRSNMNLAAGSSGMDLSTNALYLGQIGYAQTLCDKVTIHSTGRSPLIIQISALSDSSISVSRSGVVTINPGDSVVLTICCTGRAEETTDRVLKVANNAGSFDTSIAIHWRVPVPRIARNVAPILLGDVLLGDTVRARLNLRNLGYVALRIDSVQSIDGKTSGLLMPISFLQDSLIRPRVTAGTVGEEQARLILFTNDPSLPRDTIMISFTTIDSMSARSWATPISDGSDSADQIGTRVISDMHGGAFCSVRLPYTAAVAWHIDSSGLRDWSKRAKKFIAVSMAPDKGLIVARCDTTLIVEKYLPELTNLVWQQTDTTKSTDPVFLKTGPSGRVEISTSSERVEGYVNGRLGYWDDGWIFRGEVSPTGGWVYRRLNNGYAHDVARAGPNEYLKDYPGSLAMDSAGHRFDLLYLSDSISWENFTGQTHWYWHAYAGPYLRYNYSGGGSLETDRFGHLLILFDDELLKVDTLGHVLMQTKTTGADLAVDAQGSVYLLDKYDLGITKLDSNLQFMWQHSYLGDDDAAGISSAIALDRWGNVCATGTSIGQDGSADAVTMKYSPDGNRRWITKYAGLPGTPDSGSKIAVDAQGAVFVLASTTTPKGHKGLTLLKYLPPQDSFANAVESIASVEAAGLLIFPNPAKDQVTIKYHPQSFGGESGRELIVTDITGREVIKKLMTNTGGESTVSLQNLRNGLYFVRVLGEGVGAKFVIER